jgi:hypothetical protein
MSVRNVQQRSNRRDLETPDADAFCREQAILQSVQDAAGKSGVGWPASHGDEGKLGAIRQPNGLSSPAHKSEISDQQGDAREGRYPDGLFSEASHRLQKSLFVTEQKLLRVERVHPVARGDFMEAITSAGTGQGAHPLLRR